MIPKIPNREKGERVMLVLRRHPFIIFVRILFWIVAAACPIMLRYILQQAQLDVTGNDALYAITVLFISTYYLYIWLFAFHSFVDYYLDVWVVTTHRIINIEQLGLFARNVSELKLTRIQDVTYELRGFFSTILHFGNVFVQTAGEQERFIFKQIPDPESATRKIIQLSEERKRFLHMVEQDDRIRTE